MLTQKNYMKLEFPARSVNEGFARAAVAAFAAQLDPTLAEIGDIKTAVSEAVTNAVVHAYPDKLGTVQVRVRTPGVVSVGAVVPTPLPQSCAPVGGSSLVEMTSPQLPQMVSTRPALPQVAGTVRSVVP